VGADLQIAGSRICGFAGWLVGLFQIFSFRKGLKNLFYLGTKARQALCEKFYLDIERFSFSPLLLPRYASLDGAKSPGRKTGILV